MVAERAVADDVLSGAYEGVPKGWHSSFTNILAPTQSPTWDGFWTVVDPGDVHLQGYPALNWFITLTKGGHFEEVYYDQTYETVHPYGVQHQMLASHMIPLESPRYLEWASSIPDGIWQWNFDSQSNPAVTAQPRLVADGLLAAQALGFWGGPFFLLNSLPSKDSPAAAELVVAGERRLYLAYRQKSSDPAEDGRIVIQYIHLTPSLWFSQPVVLADHAQDSPGIFRSGPYGLSVIFRSDEAATLDQIVSISIQDDGSFGTPTAHPHVTTQEPAAIWWKDQAHVVYVSGDFINIAHLDDPTILGQINVPGTNTGVAVTKMDTGQCLGSWKRMFIAATDSSGVVKVYMISNFDYTASHIHSSDWISAHEVPTLTTTNNTPAIAAIQTGDPDPYLILERPFKLYLAWSLDNEVVTRRFYTDLNCTLALSISAPDHEPSTHVPQSGLASHRGPKLATSYLDQAGTADEQYRSLWMFTGTLQGPAFGMHKVLDRREP